MTGSKRRAAAAPSWDPAVGATPSHRRRAAGGVDRARIAALLFILGGVFLLARLAVPLLSPRLGAGQSVRGLIINVQSRDIGHAESITLRANDGRELRFQVDPAVDMTPGHMREHMTFGEAVTVRYRSSGSTLVAVEVGD